MLGTPPAFVLSQDQTLVFNPLSPLGVPVCTSSHKIQNSFQNQLSFPCFAFLFSILYRFQGSFLCSLREVFLALADSLISIPNVSPFVNAFLKVFCAPQGIFEHKSERFICTKRLLFDKSLHLQSVSVPSCAELHKNPYIQQRKKVRRNPRFCAPKLPEGPFSPVIGRAARPVWPVPAGYPCSCRTTPASRWRSAR